MLQFPDLTQQFAKSRPKGLHLGVFEERLAVQQCASDCLVDRLIWVWTTKRSRTARVMAPGFSTFIILLLLGGKQLPRLGRGLAESLHELRHAAKVDTEGEAEQKDTAAIETK